MEIKLMIKHIFSTSTVALAAVGTLAACTSLRVTSDVNSNQSASGCHTYAWAGSLREVNGPMRNIVNPLNEARLRSAIAANLATKGVQPATAQADCLVGYGIGSQTVVDGGYYPYGWGWGGGWGWRHGYVGEWGWDGPYAYRQGIIGVDLYDAKSRQPLWHAVVDQSVAGLTGKDAENKIKEAVAAIFTKYPS
jgi:hypothetical protein